jgi:hypothetical protein
MTPQQVEAFQERHLNHLGAPLEVDGNIGPETQWSLDIDTLSAARRAIIREAQCWIGLTENPVGSNEDPAGTIRGWLTRCGAHPREPWCASFLSHCIGTVKIAGAQALGKHFPPTPLPVAGDIFWYPTGAAGSWTGHCGLVIGVSAMEVMTLEGNCDNAVRCVRRNRFAKLRYSCVIRDTSGTHPGVVPSVPPAPGGTR